MTQSRMARMTRHMLAVATAVLGAVVLAVVQGGVPAAAQTAPVLSSASCETLASLSLPETRITSAELVPGPAFTPPGGRALDKLPAFCRVAATSAPAVRFEVWLPAAGWNGKFQGVGNGANAGSISYDAMATALRRGYAVASTDTGHATTNGRDARWALGHPELVVDFAYRGLHITTEHAKAAVRRFRHAAAHGRSAAGDAVGGGRRERGSGIPRLHAVDDRA